MGGGGLSRKGPIGPCSVTHFLMEMLLDMATGK